MLNACIEVLDRKVYEKTAKWIRHGVSILCSNCGEEIELKCDKKDKASWKDTVCWIESRHNKFCHWCGCAMTPMKEV